MLGLYATVVKLCGQVNQPPWSKQRNTQGLRNWGPAGASNVVNPTDSNPSLPLGGCPHSRLNGRIDPA